MAFSSSSYQYMVTLAIACLLYYIVSSNFNRSLNRYPGPLLAKFTKLWHYLSVRSNNHHVNMRELHRKYGDVVRTGPNSLSISRPDWVGRIYGTTSPFIKADMYDVFSHRVDGRKVVTALSQRNEKAHALYKRRIASAFSLSSLTNYEPLIDEMINRTLTRWDEKYGGSKDNVCDLGLWMRLFSMDVILYLTFGSTFGLIDSGEDSHNFFSNLDAQHDNSSLYITMPWLTKIFKFNPVVTYFSKDSSVFPRWCLAQIAKRQQEQLDPSYVRKDDFLDKFLDAAQTEEPPGIDYDLLMDWCWVNVGAGSDTTAIALRTVMYHLLKSSSKKSRLLQELDSSNLSRPVTWNEAQKLPYLDACIKEGLRLHPPVGVEMERDVTTSLEMPDGYVLPRGTIVGMSAWTVNRQTIFGDEPDEFHPERWLRGKDETEVAFDSRINSWKRVDLVFSAGSHSCSGKYVSLMEIYKLVPTLFLKYDIKLLDEVREWEVKNRFTVRQTGIECSVRPR